MFTLLKNGDHAVNRTTYQYLCDGVEDLEKIPKNKMTLGSTALVIVDGELKVYASNSKDEWVEIA